MVLAPAYQRELFHTMPNRPTPSTATLYDKKSPKEVRRCAHRLWCAYNQGPTRANQPTPSCAQTPNYSHTHLK